MTNTHNKLSRIRSNNRYSSFTFLESPVIFSEQFKSKNYDLVQIHDMTPISECGDIVGFVGAVKWENNELTPLDGDSYTAEMPVWGFSEFEYNGGQGLDILVEEW